MKPYSNDLRKRVEDKVVDVAKRFAVSIAFVYSLLQSFRDTGTYEAKENAGGAPRKISPEDGIKIWQIIEEKPDATLEEIRDHANLKVSIATFIG